jgi:Cytochrome P460
MRTSPTILGKQLGINKRPRHGTHTRYDRLKGTIVRTAPKELAAVVACMLFAAVAVQCAKDIRSASSSVAIANNASPIFGIKIPPGYRDWRVISVAHEAGSNNDLRVVLGNDVAIKAFREGTLPYPDGTIIVRLAWRYTPSAENDKVLGRGHSFVAGSPINVQFDVKDSRKYASTGGWGFAQFKDGKPADSAVQATCFPCHAVNKANDLVFTHYSATP